MKNNNCRKPLVSIIIATYNSGQTISRAVSSVIQQSYDNIELIIVDDGSFDNTAEIVMPFVDGIRVIYIYQNNSGVSAARNKGALLAKGEWLAFLDADDEWHPQKLELQIESLQFVPDAVLISNVPLRVSQNGKNFQFPVLDVTDLKDKLFFWRQEEFLRRNKIHTSSVLVRRDTFNEVGGFDEMLKIAEDRDLWLKILYKGQGICLNMPLTKYYETEGSLSRKIVERFEYNLKLIDRWDNRRQDTLDKEKRISVKNFIKIKYAVLFTMIFKLLKYGFVEEAYLFWLKLRDFHKKEFPCLPFIPWCLFVMMARVEFLRKRFKRAVKRFLL